MNFSVYTEPERPPTQRRHAAFGRKGHGFDLGGSDAGNADYSA